MMPELIPIIVANVLVRTGHRPGDLRQGGKPTIYSSHRHIAKLPPMLGVPLLSNELQVLLFDFYIKVYVRF